MADREKTDDREWTLESRLTRLEDIVGSLERNDLDLEAAMTLFEEGVSHIRRANEVLQKGTLRVERLITGADGVPVLEQVDEDE